MRLIMVDLFFFLHLEKILFRKTHLVFYCFIVGSICLKVEAQTAIKRSVYLSKVAAPNDTIQHSNEAVKLLARNDSAFYFSQKSAPRQKIAEFRLFYSQKKAVQEVKIPFAKELMVDRLLFADADNKTLFFTCALNHDDIYFSKLLSGKWQKPMPFSALNSSFRESGMCISPDKQMIVFASDRKEGTNLDLYVVKYQEDGLWGKPELISTLASGQDEDDPVFSMDGKTLYFASKGFNGYGNYDLFLSTFDETSKTWSAPVNAGVGINSEFSEVSPALNSKGDLALYCSDRHNKSGDYDLYRPVRETKVLLSVQVNNQDSSLQIGNLQIRLKPDDGLAADGPKEMQSKTGVYADSLFLNRGYTLQILDGNQVLVTDRLRFKPDSNYSKSYYISLSKIKDPYLVYEGKKIPLLTKYIFRYEKNELLPMVNNERTLERVAELLGHLHIYQVEIQYPAQLTNGAKRVDSLQKYLLKKGASAKDLLLTKQSTGNPDELQLKMEFKSNVH